MTGLPGVRVGHWTEPHARTGCTVVLLPEGTLASGEVRGGAPATREFAWPLVGRDDQLSALVGLLEQSGERPVFAVVTG